MPTCKINVFRRARAPGEHMLGPGDERNDKNSGNKLFLAFRCDNGINRPKASNGRRFPCPAQLVFAMTSFFVFTEGSGAEAPIGCEVL